MKIIITIFKLVHAFLKNNKARQFVLIGLDSYNTLFMLGVVQTITINLGVQTLFMTVSAKLLQTLSMSVSMSTILFAHIVHIFPQNNLVTWTEMDTNAVIIYYLQIKYSREPTRSIKFT